MAGPYFWHQKLILAKIGTGGYPTDPTPTGSANAILATNVTFAPMEGQDVPRNIERPYNGAQENLPTGLYGTLTFDVEMVGSGTLGVAPAWGPLHRMCGCAETIVADTSVEYDPISATYEWGQLYMYIGGNLHKLPGVRGNWVHALTAQGIPVWRYSFRGLFVVPTAAAVPASDFTAFQVPTVATKANTPTFTIGGTAMRLRSWELNRGAQVENRFLVGYEAIEIVDAVETLKCQVEAVDLATYNPFTAPTGSPVAIQLVHGTDDTKRVQLDVFNAKQRRVSGFTPEQRVIEWPLDFDPLPDEGNDQWKITLAAAA